YVQHELVEMRTALARHRARLKKQIHQHGLAAADLAVNVESFDWRQRARAFGKQPAERRRFSREPVLQDARFEPRQPLDDIELRGVALDQLRGDAGLVLRGDGARHAGRIVTVNACGSKKAGTERIAALLRDVQAFVGEQWPNLEAMQTRNVRMPPKTSPCHYFDATQHDGSIRCAGRLPAISSGRTQREGLTRRQCQETLECWKFFPKAPSSANCGSARPINTASTCSVSIRQAGAAGSAARFPTRTLPITPIAR